MAALDKLRDNVSKLFSMSDVESLTNLDGALEATYSTLSNRSTGLGTSRDKSTHVEINQPYFLSAIERNNIVRSSRIARKAVTLYPIEASRGWVEFTGTNLKDEPKKLQDYFRNLKTGTLRSAFTEASIEAKWHGDGYILLGIDDGQSFDQPVNENKIKSLRWVEPLTWDEVTPDGLLLSRHPEYYYVSISSSGLIPNLEGDRKISSMRVHRSRILRFYGDRLYGSALYNNAGRNDSVIQTMFAAFSSYTMGLMSAGSMLADYSVFKYKLSGLAKLIQSGNQDAILQRFLVLQMGMSSVRALAVDAENEDAEFIQRNYGGVPEMLNVLLDQLVAASDIPKSKLLGVASSGGLGTVSKGEQDRYEWASLVNAYQVDSWLSHLEYVSRIVYLAKDGVTSGKLPKDGFGIKFQNILQLTPLEQQDLELKAAQKNKLNIESKIYSPYEARMSGFSSSQWSSEIILDEQLSEKMKREMLDEPKEVTPEVTKDSYNQDKAIKKILVWKNLSIGLEVLSGESRFGRVLKDVNYGHIRKHIGEDKEALDCYVNQSVIDGKGSNLVSRVTQLAADGDGDFDEYKYFIGYSVAEAKTKYLELMPSYMMGGVKKVTLKDISRFRKDSVDEIEGQLLEDSEFEDLAKVSKVDILNTLSSILE